MHPPLHGLWLLQKAVDVDLAAGAEIDTSADDDGDGEADGHAGAIALAVLLRSVDRLAEFGGIEGVKDSGLSCQGRSRPWWRWPTRWRLCCRWLRWKEWHPSRTCLLTKSAV